MTNSLKKYILLIKTNLMVLCLIQAERAADLIQGKQMLPPANVPVYQPATLETRR